MAYVSRLTVLNATVRELRMQACINVQGLRDVNQEADRQQACVSDQ
jgi:hypothetical protein